MQMTKKETLILEREAALHYIRRVKGRVRFQVMVTAFLPTEGTKGFPGSTCISVSRKQALEIAADMTEHFSERGAKLRMDVSPPSYEGGLSFVSIH